MSKERIKYNKPFSNGIMSPSIKVAATKIKEIKK